MKKKSIQDLKGKALESNKVRKVLGGVRVVTDDCLLI